MLVSKWHTFVGSALIQMCAGILYCFSIYSAYLKEHFDLSQTQLQQLGFAVNLGGSLAIFAGATFNHFAGSHQLGPRLVVWMGCLCCTVGYLGLYLCSTGFLPASYWQLLLFCCLAGNSTTWLDAAALVTNMWNFPRDRGTTVGLLKAFLGLSASVYSSVYLAAFAPSIPKFLLFLAIGPPLLCLAASGVVNHVPYVEHGEVHPPSPWLSSRVRFLGLYVLVAVILLYQFAATLLSFSGHLAQREHRLQAAGLLLLLAASAGATFRSGGWRSRPAVLPSSCDSVSDASTSSPKVIHSAPAAARSTDNLIHRKGAPSSTALSSLASDSAPLIQHTASDADPDADAGSKPHQPPGQVPSSHPRQQQGSPPGTGPASAAGKEEQEDPTILTLPLLLRNNPTTNQEEEAIEATAAEMDAWQVMGTDAFWMLFLQFCVGIGSGFTFLNNLAQISTSLGGRIGSHVVFVSVLSVFNGVGRLVVGMLSEHYLHRHATPRPVFLAGTGALSMVGALVAAYAPLRGLFAASVVEGLAFGAHWTLIPAIASDLFGLKYFASIYAVLQLAPAIGSYIMSTILAGWVYDSQAARQGSPDFVCTGSACFRTTFSVLAGLCTVSFLGTVRLSWNTRKTYQRISRLMHNVDEVLREEEGEWGAEESGRKRGGR